MPETRYAPCGDLSLAYQVFGDGPIELVVAAPFTSHVELFWTMPEFVAFFERLSTFCRVLLFDKAGAGRRTRCRKFAPWMIGRPRSRLSWTPSASNERCFSG